MSKQANKTVNGILRWAPSPWHCSRSDFGLREILQQTFKRSVISRGPGRSEYRLRGVQRCKNWFGDRGVFTFRSAKLIFVIPVYMEIERDEVGVIGVPPKQEGESLKIFIDQGLRATLEMQSFVTGQMQVGLDFHPDKPARFAENKVDTKTRRSRPYLHRCRSWPKRFRIYRSTRSSRNWPLPSMKSISW